MISIMNPYVILAALVLLIGTNISSFIYGKHVEEAEHAEEHLKAVNEAKAKADEASSINAKRQQEIDALIARLDEKVTSYALSSGGRVNCLDDAGVRLFNEIGGYPGVRPELDADGSRAASSARRSNPR